MDIMLFQALREFTTGLLNQLLVNLAGQDGQKWLAEFKKFLRQEPCWVNSVKDSVHEAKVYYLKRLFADQVITFGDAKGDVHVYELVKNATFQQMFEDVGEKRRCWKNKEEALTFAGQNENRLCPNGNFFELEGGFVVFVDLNRSGQPYVFHMYPLSRDSHTWLAVFRRRVFFPQQ